MSIRPWFSFFALISTFTTRMDSSLNPYSNIRFCFISLAHPIEHILFHSHLHDMIRSLPGSIRSFPLALRNCRSDIPRIFVYHSTLLSSSTLTSPSRALLGKFHFLPVGLFLCFMNKRSHISSPSRQDQIAWSNIPSSRIISFI